MWDRNGTSAGRLAPVRRAWWGLLGPVGAASFLGGVVVASQQAGVSLATGGYLSDLGAAGAAGAGGFRLGLGAASVACLAVALAATSRLPWRDPRVVLLVAAGADLALQTLVRCDGSCRLPVDDGAVPAADLAHFVVAAVGFALWVGVTAVDVVDPWPVAPRLSVLATTSYAGHLTLLGALLLVDPHGPASAVLQRTLVLTGLGWTAAVGVLLVVQRGDPAPDRGD